MENRKNIGGVGKNGIRIRNRYIHAAVSALSCCRGVYVFADAYEKAAAADQKGNAGVLFAGGCRLCRAVLLLLHSAQLCFFRYGFPAALYLSGSRHAGVCRCIQRENHHKESCFSLSGTCRRICDHRDKTQRRCCSRVVKDGQGIQSSAFIMLGAAIVYGVINLFVGFQPPTAPAGYAAVLLIAFVSTVAAFWAFFTGMEITGPSVASLVSTLEPVVTVIASVVILSEPLTANLLVGGVLVLSSLVVTMLPGKTNKSNGESV